MKCSLLVNNIIRHERCVKLDLQTSVGAVRDPNLQWVNECPKDTAVVGLAGDNGFRSLKHIKCCEMTGMLARNPLFIR